MNLNSKGPFPSSGREIKFRSAYTFSIKREIKGIHAVVVQKRQRNVQKSVNTCEVVVFLLKLMFSFDVRVVAS